jgi:rhodanese-related sulfurtransferase
VGARVCLGARAEADYEFLPLADGDTLDLGATRLQALETPGHTPEAISLLVYDLERSSERPHAVLTGDTLFIGDVGRPDLMASQGVAAEDLATMLYHSLRERLLPLPDETLVYPGHGAGSLCGRSLSSEKVSTIGEQRAYNYALQPMGEEAFVELIAADQPPAPDYFAYDAELNRREHQTLDEALERELTPLDLEAVLGQVEAGAQLLDSRDAGQFAAAHLRDAWSIGLGGEYASWAGAMLDRDRPIVIIAEPGSEREAAVRLGRVGLDNVAGYLAGGMAALEPRPDLIASFTRLAPATLAARLAAAQPPFLIDVRRAPEVDGGRIEGSVQIELSELPGRLTELPRDRPVVAYCAGGYRSSAAASVLLRHGFTDVADLAGGYAAWEATVVPPV